MASPQATNIKRTRGDTAPDAFALIDENGVAIDITSWTFKLTVDPSSDPTDALNNLFELTEVITDATGGLFQFEPTTGEADQTPSVYFYDIEATDDTSKLITLAKGEYEFLQDITK